MKYRIITLCGLLALLPCAVAQRAGHASYRGSFNVTGHSAIGRSARSAGFGRRTPYTSLPFPLFSYGFGDAFDLDDLYASGYPVASQPPVILMQAGRGMSDAYDSRRSSDQAQPSAEPLMIELQNGRYVHVKRAAVDGEATPLSFDTQPAAKPQPAQISASQNIPSTILIFRDGQSLEVRDYTIANGTLYANGDYYTDGYWNKQIALSSLNLPATLQANARRNVKFVVPSAPNEVIASF